MTRRKHTQTERNRKHTEQLEEQQEQNMNTGYPALDPTANKYLSGSGWEISFFFCFGFASSPAENILQKQTNKKKSRKKKREEHTFFLFFLGFFLAFFSANELG